MAGVAPKLRRVPWAMVLIIAIFILFAAVPGLFGVGRSMIEVSLYNRFLPPSWISLAETGHLLGTDHLGRDVWAMVILATRVTLWVSVAALSVAMVVGTFIGIVSGYFGGKLDAVAMRFVDATFSLPTTLVAMVLAITLGPTTSNIIIVVLLVLWARFARVIRSEVLVVKKKDFVQYAKVAGRSDFFIMVRHILPNVTHTIMVLVSLNIGWVIVLTATLSFLGAGIPPTIPNWGSMLAEARSYLATAWWAAVFPGMAIFLITLAFNLFGDWLRDFMDPRLRQV